MERTLLNFWKWDLNCATSLHFLEHLLSCNLFPSQDKELDPCRYNNFKDQAISFANLTLFEVQFIYFKPSVIAASCIAATRMQFQLFPIWSSRLELLTNYSFSDIELCLQHLIHFAQVTKNESLNFVPKSHNCNYSCYENKSDWKRLRLKTPVSTYNCSKFKRRHLLQPRDLKHMYCAM